MNQDLRASSDCELTPPMLDLIEILARIAYENLRRESAPAPAGSSATSNQAA